MTNMLKYFQKNNSRIKNIISIQLLHEHLLAKIKNQIHKHNQCNGVVARVSASQSIDLGFIPLVESYQKTLKMASAASLLGVQHLGEVVENKLASLLVVSLGKTLNRMPNLYVEDRWPINLKKGNSQASADFPSKI